MTFHIYDIYIYRYMSLSIIIHKLTGCKLDRHQNTKPGCVDHGQWSWHLKIPSEFFHEHISKFPNEVTEHGMRCAIVLQCRFFSCAVSTASCPQSQFLALSLYPQFFLEVARKTHKPTLKEPQVRPTAISKT